MKTYNYWLSRSQPNIDRNWFHISFPVLSTKPQIWFAAGCVPAKLSASCRRGFQRWSGVCGPWSPWRGTAWNERRGELHRVRWEERWVTPREEWRGELHRGRRGEARCAGDTTILQLCASFIFSHYWQRSMCTKFQINAEKITQVVEIKSNYIKDIPSKLTLAQHNWVVSPGFFEAHDIRITTMCN